MKDSTLFFLAEYIGAPLVKMLGSTIKISTSGEEHLEKVRLEGSWIYAQFHGRMFLPVFHHRNQGIVTLVSQSKDGEAVTRLVKHLGHSTIRGSAHRGGVASIRKLATTIKDGTVIGMMVDGSKGPIYEPKIGTIAIARLSGKPILPMGAAAKNSWELHSWDKTQIPKFFTKGFIVYSEPLYIPTDVKGDELEEYRLELKKRMLEAQNKAESEVKKK